MLTFYSIVIFVLNLKLLSDFITEQEVTQTLRSEGPRHVFFNIYRQSDRASLEGEPVGS